MRVVGVEAAQSPALRTALDAGHPVAISPGPTLADGLAGNFEPGSVTFDLVRRTVADVVTVSEDEIATAMRFLAREHGIVAEGSGAVGVAALLNGSVAPDRRRDRRDHHRPQHRRVDAHRRPGRLTVLVLNAEVESVLDRDALTDAIAAALSEASADARFRLGSPPKPRTAGSSRRCPGRFPVSTRWEPSW